MENIKLEFNSFLSDKIKEYNDFVLSKECNKKPNDEILKVSRNYGRCHEICKKSSNSCDWCLQPLEK